MGEMAAAASNELNSVNSALDNLLARLEKVDNDLASTKKDLPLMSCAISFGIEVTWAEFWQWLPVSRAWRHRSLSTAADRMHRTRFTFMESVLRSHM